MGKNSKISWTHHTFSPWIGCTNCYAETFDRRVGGVPRTRTSPSYWRQPLRWDCAAREAGERHRVFCASLADVFDPEVPREWRGDLYALIEKTPNLDWLLLTKRPEHIGDMAVPGCFPPNVWLGVTVENQEQANRRIPLLLEWPATVRFLSCEPLLERVTLPRFCLCGCKKSVNEVLAEPSPLNREQREDGLRIGLGVDWVIIGGESGPKARPFDVAWARSLINQCRDGGRAAPFVKQLGSRPVFGGPEDWPPDLHRELDANGYDAEEIELAAREGRIKLRDAAGGDWSEWPEGLRVRELPEVG